MFDEALITSLQNAKHIAVLTGAGVSAESGIPTFRDAMTGLWEKYDPQQLASEHGFRSYPALVWGWYEWRRSAVIHSSPNPAHLAIAQLQQVIPKLTLISQNVDDLHERAGSRDVLHLHGSLHAPHCIDCLQPYDLPREASCDLHESKRIEPPICLHCGDLIRPGVVWFGESLPLDSWHDAEAAALIFLRIASDRDYATIPVYSSIVFKDPIHLRLQCINVTIGVRPKYICQNL